MVEFLYLILALAIIFFSYLTFQTIAGIICGGKIDAIGVFFGPTILKIPIGKTVIKIGCIPLGGYVKFTDEFEHLNIFRKILVVLLGVSSYFIIAAICLGFSEAVAQTFSAFGQLFRLLFSPIDVGSKYIETAVNLVNEKSFIYELGVVSAKVLAFNLLPLTSLNGGQLLFYFLKILGLKSEKIIERYAVLSGILNLILFAAIIISTIAYFFKT